MPAAADARPARAGKMQRASARAPGVEHRANFVPHAPVRLLRAEVVEIVLAGELKYGLALLLVAQMQVHVRHRSQNLRIRVQVVEPRHRGGDLPGATEGRRQGARSAPQPKKG